MRFIGLAFLIVIVLFVSAAIGIGALGLLEGISLFISPWLAGLPLILMCIFGFYMWFIFWAVMTKAVALVYQTTSKDKAL